MRSVIRPFKSLVAVLLLTLWVPATAHCALAAATDWLVELCAVACCADDAERVAHADGCEVVEGGDFIPGSTQLKAPSLQLIILACLAQPPSAPLAVASVISPPSAGSGDDPASWVPTWVFVARAALPARAPTLT